MQLESEYSLSNPHQCRRPFTEVGPSNTATLWKRTTATMKACDIFFNASLGVRGTVTYAGILPQDVAEALLVVTPHSMTQRV